MVKTLIHEGADPEVCGGYVHPYCIVCPLLSDSFPLTHTTPKSFALTPLDILHIFAPLLIEVEHGLCGRSKKELFDDFVDCCYFLQSKGCSFSSSLDLLGPQSSLLIATTAFDAITGGWPGVQRWGQFISSVGVSLDGFCATDVNVNALIATSRLAGTDVMRIAALPALGADVHATCSEGMQPLHRIFHCVRGYLTPSGRRAVRKTAFILIQAGADLGFRDIWGNKPKHYAARAGLLCEYKEAVRRARPSVLDSFSDEEEWHSWFDEPTESYNDQEPGGQDKDKNTCMSVQPPARHVELCPGSNSMPGGLALSSLKIGRARRREILHGAAESITKMAAHPYLPLNMLLRFCIFFINSLSAELACYFLSAVLSVVFNVFLILMGKDQEFLS